MQYTGGFGLYVKVAGSVRSDDETVSECSDIVDTTIDIHDKNTTA